MSMHCPTSTLIFHILFLSCCIFLLSSKFFTPYCSLQCSDNINFVI
uniref:Uncharacterized protein n=1 Tax=Arundo donax TaxID=35708 RepID=A0A0A9CC69_ARUDO